MADLPDPTDEGLITLNVARREFERLIDRDGIRDADEMRVLSLLVSGIQPIDRGRRVDRLTTYIKRGGDITSRYGQQMAAEAGVFVAPLEEKPMEQPARVVRLDDRRNGPDEAA